MTRDEVLSKIRKLLRLGESANEHEAALAVARAQALMEKHRITQAALAIESDEGPTEEIRHWDDPLDPFPDKPAKRLSQWRVRLGSTLARANGCSIFMSGASVHLVGRASNVQQVRYLYAFCWKEIDRLTSKFGAGNGRTWGANFRLGCVDAIAIAIEAERRAAREELRGAVPNERALVLVDKAIAKVDDELREVSRYEKEKLNIRRGRGFAGPGYSPSAREQGRQAGASIYPGRNARGGIGPGTKRLPS
jgi:hypothetical protein